MYDRATFHVAAGTQAILVRHVAIAIVLAIALIPTSARAADNYLTVQKLRDACVSDDPDGRKACGKLILLYVENREKLWRLEHWAANKEPESRLCPPMPAGEGLRLFLSWSELHRDHWQENWMDGLTQAWSTEFPCTKP
jgi:hypothetical protein